MSYAWPGTWLAEFSRQVPDVAVLKAEEDLCAAASKAVAAYKAKGGQSQCGDASDRDYSEIGASTQRRPRPTHRSA